MSIHSSFIVRFLSWLEAISGKNASSEAPEKKHQESDGAAEAVKTEIASARPSEGVPPMKETTSQKQKSTELSDAARGDKARETNAFRGEKGRKASSAPRVPSERTASKLSEQKPDGKEESENEVDVQVAQVESRQVKPMENWTVPPMERENPQDVLFQDFPLDPRILRAVLEDLQFKKCSPIQGMVLPHALAGEDMAGKAQTGTGKTAAFLITILQRFLKSDHAERKENQPFALALAPTRELAIQIAHDANALCAYCHFRTVAVYGGMDYDRQRRLLQSHVDFVVATPGRLIDFLENHVVSLDRIEALVIDEADRMLDMGFIPDVKRIIFRLGDPSKRQTMLFSATLNQSIMNLASRWMRPNPVVLEAEPDHIVAEGVDETIYAVTAAEKLPILLWTLSHEECRRVLIFRNRRSDVESLHSALQRYGVASEMLSGDVDQKKRLRILEDFKNGKVTVIVATDVAGRGIHVDDVTHVVNYDFPYEAEDYVHRVGRTARAGHHGRAISFADEESAFVVPDIEKYIGRPLPISYPEDEMLKLPEAVQENGTAETDGAQKGSPRRGHGGGYRHGGSSHRGGAPRRH